MSCLAHKHQQLLKWVTAESSIAEKLLVVRSIGVVNMEARLELTSAIAVSANPPVALQGWLAIGRDQRDQTFNVMIINQPARQEG